MVLLQSKSSNLSIKCPDFSLQSVVNNEVYGLNDFKSEALLIAFICNHCPYVRAIEERLIALKQAFDGKDFEIVGICSNDAQSYPSDSPKELNKRWHELNYGFPYLIDSDQTVAKAFDAVCTPDLFLFDKERKLFYHGRLDDNWQDASKVTKEELKDAIKALLKGEAPPLDQKPSLGCSIKWRHA